MASNPMQRKARSSFLLGMLVAILIAAIVIAFLVMQILGLKKEQEKQEANTREACVLMSDIKSGQEITSADLEKIKIEANAVPSNVLTDPLLPEGTVAKIDMNSGTVVTVDMLDSTGIELTNDLRIQEYNMLGLPSDIEEGDFVDIRLTLPSGEDYLVVSKKEVVKTSLISPTTAWLKMTELELLVMSNAIIESYIMTGSNLYAVKYVEPGLQETPQITYVVSKEVLDLINADPNIITTARNALWDRYGAEGVAAQRNNNITNNLNQYAEERIDNVQQKIEEQRTKQQEERQLYLDSLSGEI